jgi:hypothetical protein
MKLSGVVDDEGCVMTLKERNSGSAEKRRLRSGDTKMRGMCGCLFAHDIKHSIPFALLH